jgi:hypothetical protein
MRSGKSPGAPARLPFAEFNSDSAEPVDNLFENWDPFDQSSDSHASDGAQFSNFFAQPPYEIPVQHRQVVSRLRSNSTVQLPTIQPPYPPAPPAAQSAWDFTEPRTPFAPSVRLVRSRPFLSPRPDAAASDDAALLAACRDPHFALNPALLGFIPATSWTDRHVRFGELVREFFQRKNNANCRFSHKLFNALQLSQAGPEWAKLVGVSWLNDTILRVDKRAFARLLGIRSIDGSLFHQQGNFPSHGFIEIGAGDVRDMCPADLDMSGVDFENVRLLFHPEQAFRRGCTEADIDICRWMGSKGGRSKDSE